MMLKKDSAYKKKITSAEELAKKLLQINLEVMNRQDIIDFIAHGLRTYELEGSNFLVI